MPRREGEVLRLGTATVETPIQRQAARPGNCQGAALTRNQAEAPAPASVPACRGTLHCLLARIVSLLKLDGGQLVDTATATIIAALIGAIASVIVAWISSRPQSLREGLPPSTSKITSLNYDLGVAKQPRDETSAAHLSSIPTNSTIKTSLLPFSKIILWTLYIVTGFFAFCTLSSPFTLTAISRHPLGGESTMIMGVFIFYLIITLVFLAVTRYFRRRVYPK